jgi:serine/threonine-protein kinase HipA
MGRKKRVKILNIFLNGAKVGLLKKETSGLISFRYTEDWLDYGVAISNSLPLQEDEYKGEVVSRYFDNLLPDNNDIKNIVATKYGAESTRSFDMLEVIGKDCVGALSFLPEGQEPINEFEMNYTPLSEREIARRIKGLGSTNPLGMDQADFRISIAGAQEKTAFLNIDGKWYEPHGLTPTTHIFKTSIGALGVDINFEDSIDNEWSSLLLMKKFGLDVCETHIEQFENQRVLVIKRFDRIWKNYKGKEILLRTPQEDICQAFNVSPYQKYQNEGGPGIEDISRLLMASNNANDRINFFKAIVVFDLLYATDGHAKNFSLFVEKDGYRLTPFYDVMGGYFLHKREGKALQDLKLAMKVGDSGHYAFKRINRSHYAQTAKKCGINKELFEQIMEDVKTSLTSLVIESHELDPKLNQDTLALILEGMEKRAVKIL